jgi:hypothetical protein
MRRTQVKNSNKWLDINFEDLKSGDEFRLYDDEDIVIDKKGRSSWIASSNPYFNEDNILKIDILT